MKQLRKMYPVLLLALAGLILLMSYQKGSLYGAVCDWFSQSVSIAETMRQTILEEGTLFPGQLPLGGQNNIYDFAYYGYLRPDVLISCLLPGVPMEIIIPVYAAAGYLCSVLLFYILARKMKVREETAFWGGILFLCAGCFFQIHRQIMFINYMPFLLGELLCVLQRRRTGKSPLLVLMLVLIELHSYYYAISCLLVVYLFWLYTAEWKPQKLLKQFFGQTVEYGLRALLSVAMSAVLLLPSAASILNCAGAKDGGSAGTNPWELHLDFGFLLYHGYGVGLTLVVLFLLLLSLCRKKSRILAAVILFSLVCGLVPLVLNGFLYSREKILMPFLPMILLLALETLEYFWKQKKRPPLWSLLPLGYAAYLQYQSHGERMIWIDFSLVLLLFLVLYLRSAKREGLQKGALTVILVGMSSLIFLFSVKLHQGEDMITEEAAVVSSFSKQERETFYEDTSYRFDSFRNPYQTGNSLLAYGAGRTSMYTSTANPRYSTFFYDEIKNPIGSNNRVALLNRANPFFLYLMGVRYLEATKATLPYGYEIKLLNGNSLLAENKDVLPLCYGTTELLDEKAYQALPFPQNLEAITARSVVADGKGQKSFVSQFQEIFPEEGKDYRISQLSETSCLAELTEPLENQILIIDFKVKRTSRAAASITINGITNKLSGASAPYPNHNENFTYILSSQTPITEIQVKTSGSYEISRLHVYKLDAARLGGRTVYHLEEEPAQGQEKIKGSITMPSDGYLITSLPIQSGYRAYVDGKPCQVETVNEAFVGLPLSQGLHDIAILYEPPMEKAGMAVSGIGWSIWLVLLIMGFWGKKKPLQRSVKK